MENNKREDLNRQDDVVDTNPEHMHYTPGYTSIGTSRNTTRTHEPALKEQESSARLSEETSKNAESTWTKNQPDSSDTAFDNMVDTDQEGSTNY
jgi:hypothetical protein